MLPISRKRKTASEINVEYRNKIKLDPVKYAEYVDKNKSKCQLYRQEIKGDEEKRKRNNELAKMRMAKMRERKNQGKLANGKEKMKTRHDDEGEKKEERTVEDFQAKRTGKLDTSKKAAVNRKRRNQRREKKEFKEATELAKKQMSTACQAGLPAIVRSEIARRVAHHRAKKGMPSDPQHYAETWMRLDEKASPGKRKPSGRFSQALSMQDWAVCCRT